MQVSAIVPLLKWFTAARVVFYGHFPDQLLATRSSPLRRVYRAPFDLLERKTTGSAHQLLVNSRFTQQVYREVFGAALADRAQILYPCVRVPSTQELARQQKNWQQRAFPFFGARR